MDVINRLKFDPNCIGSDLMALSVKPVYLYENGKRVSDEVVSFKYEILCPALGYEKLAVKVGASAKQLDVSEEPFGSRTYWLRNVASMDAKRLHSKSYS